MTVITHCLPNMVLGSHELPVPNISANNSAVVHATTGIGNRRGVIVFMHGLQSTQVLSSPAPVVADTGTAGFYSYLLTFANVMAADGWEVLFVPYQEDGFAGIPATGFYNDVANDTANGGRYFNSLLHTWDHIVNYIRVTYGTNWPIVPFGVSKGGFTAMTVAANRQSSIVAYGVHVPTIVWETLAPAFTANTGLTYGKINWQGLDMLTAGLNAVTVPGIVGYGTGDTAVGYSGSTVRSTSNGVDVATFTGTQSLFVQVSANFNVGPLVMVTGLSGGSGFAVLSFTATASQRLNNCKLVNGAGTLQTGNPIVQANTVQLLAAAQAAGSPVTANVTPDTHEFGPWDAGAYAFPTGLGGATTLATIHTAATMAYAVNGTYPGATPTSGGLAIYASDGVWHTITFTAIGAGPSLTNPTFSGTQSATVTNTSPIALTHYASGASYPWWFSQVVDPLCPKVL